jgi:hypothetical protein
MRPDCRNSRPGRLVVVPPRDVAPVTVGTFQE